MIHWRDFVAKLCGWVSAAFLAAMLLLIVVDVVLRKFGLSPIHGTFELVELLLVCTFFFALPATFLRDENIVVDMIDTWRPRWVPALKRASAAAAVVLLATIAWQSWLQARDAMSFGDVTSDLSLPKILYWAPLVFGIAAGAVAAAAMALKRSGPK
jgi:TRAP-type C4-dicarboxylate transport system permease small subunit